MTLAKSLKSSQIFQWTSPSLCDSNFQAEARSSSTKSIKCPIQLESLDHQFIPFLFSDSLLLSPPRAPLQVVNGPNPALTPSNLRQHNKVPEESSNFGRISASPALERLFKKISKRNSKGETPLHTAAIRGSPRLVRQLLMMGADPNAQDHAEWSPLHEVSCVIVDEIKHTLHQQIKVLLYTCDKK